MFWLAADIAYPRPLSRRPRLVQGCDVQRPAARALAAGVCAGTRRGVMQPRPPAARVTRSGTARYRAADGIAVVRVEPSDPGSLRFPTSLGRFVQMRISKARVVQLARRGRCGLPADRLRRTRWTRRSWGTTTRSRAAARGLRHLSGVRRLPAARNSRCTCRRARSGPDTGVLGSSSAVPTLELACRYPDLVSPRRSVSRVSTTSTASSVFFGTTSTTTTAPARTLPNTDAAAGHRAWRA